MIANLQMASMLVQEKIITKNILYFGFGFGRHSRGRGYECRDNLKM